MRRISLRSRISGGFCPDDADLSKIAQQRMAASSSAGGGEVAGICRFSVAKAMEKTQESIQLVETPAAVDATADLQTQQGIPRGEARSGEA